VNFRTTGILLVLVLAGGALWLFAPRGPESVTEPEKSTTSRIRYALDPRPQEKRFVRVTIEQPDKPQIVFEREPGDENKTPGDWRMLKPIETAATNYMVNSLISTFVYLRSQHEATDVGPTDAGLDKPRATFTFVNAEDKTYVFEIGGEVPFTNNTYVRIRTPDGSSKIHVVARTFDTELKREPNDYRERSLAKFSRNDVVRVEMQHKGRTYRFTRNKAKEWVIDEPVKAYADSQKVRTLVNNIANLRVQEFIEDAPQSLEPFGLDKPFLTVTIRTEREEETEEAEEDKEKGHKQETTEPEAQESNEKTTTQPAKPKSRTIVETIGLAVGDYSDLDKKNRYIKRLDAPWVASVSQASIERIVPNLSELRDNRITRILSNDVTELTITHGKSTATLRREAGHWRGSGDLAKLETEAVRDVLAALEHVRAIDFIDEPQNASTYGLDKPRAVLRITTRGSVEPLVLKIGSNTPSGRNTYVQVVGQPTVHVVSRTQAERLAIDPISLRSRVVFDLPPDTLQRIERDGPGGRRVIERTEGTWHMVEPATAPLDGQAAADLADNIPRLHARKVVARDNFERYGLDRPVAVLHFTARSAPATTQPTTVPATASATAPTTAPAPPVKHTLYVARVEGITYARRDHSPFVFELDETLYPVLTAELINRRLLDLKPDDVTAFVVETKDAQLTFRRTKDGWTYEEDPYVRLAKKKVQDAIGLVCNLKVQRYDAYTGSTLGSAASSASLTIRLERRNGPPVTLRIGTPSPDDGMRLGEWVEPGRVFHLGPDALDKLPLSLDGYLKEAAS